MKKRKFTKPFSPPPPPLPPYLFFIPFLSLIILSQSYSFITTQVLVVSSSSYMKRYKKERMKREGENKEEREKEEGEKEESSWEKTSWSKKECNLLIYENHEISLPKWIFFPFLPFFQRQKSLFKWVFFPFLPFFQRQKRLFLSIFYFSFFLWVNFWVWEKYDERKDLLFLSLFPRENKRKGAKKMLKARERKREEGGK